jgi:DNA-directed RNA polymerase alpha subunit
MAEYMITRASIINDCNTDGKVHLFFTEKEKPCEEAYLKELKDNDGELCSRYFINLNTIEDVDELGTKYDVDVMVTRNMDFNGIISLVLYDEELDRDRFEYN